MRTVSKLWKLLSGLEILSSVVSTLWPWLLPCAPGGVVSAVALGAVELPQPVIIAFIIATAVLLHAALIIKDRAHRKEIAQVIWTKNDAAEAMFEMLMSMNIEMAAWAKGVSLDEAEEHFRNRSSTRLRQAESVDLLHKFWSQFERSELTASDRLRIAKELEKFRKQFNQGTETAEPQT